MTMAGGPPDYASNYAHAFAGFFAHAIASAKLGPSNRLLSLP